MPLDADGILRRAQPMLDRIGEGEPHADGDRLAMQQPVGIAGEGFERMAEGMAEIEQRPGAGLSSRSSASTMAALARTLVSTACRRVAA